MQNIIVILIVLASFSYVGWKFYKMLTRKPNPDGKCGGCTGCSLKEDLSCSVHPESK